MRHLRALASTPALLVTLALLFLAALLVGGALMWASEIGLGFDFRFQYYDGATAIAHGDPLYTSPDDVALEVGMAYVYPPPLAVALTPVTLLSRDAATLGAIVAAVLAIWASLAIVGVRDLRCYGAVTLTAPFGNILETANVTALLVLGLALAWRLRSTVWPLAVVLGLAFATKLFLWPVAVWALATRRPGAALRAALVAGVTLLVTWSAAAFQGLGQYTELVSKLSKIHAEASYSVVGMGAALGLGSGAARLLALLVGGALLVLCVALGRRGDDVGAFTFAVAAALALAPILWLHYLCLLLVPLGIARPRFSLIWLLPVVLWVVPRVGHGHGIEPFLPFLVATALVAAVVAPHSRGHRRLVGTTT